jgi:hypothetical protein
VSDRREIAAGGKNIRKQTAAIALVAEGAREIHTYGSYAHDATAAFAVIHGAHYFAAARLQRGEAGGSRRAAAEKSFLLEQPAGFCVTRGNQPGILLGHEPACVGSGAGAKKVGLVAMLCRGDVSREQSFGGEEGHLRVISYGAQLSVGRGIVADSSFPKSADNFVEIQEFNGSAKGVADGATEQASTETGAHASIGGDAGKGHFSLEPWSRFSIAEQDTAIRQMSASLMMGLGHLNKGTLSLFSGNSKEDTLANSG